MAKGVRKVLKDGKWVEGKASPELLREDLRAMPSDLITKDVDDNDRIHELDPEHTFKDAINDYNARQNSDGADQSLNDAVKKLPAPKYGEQTPLTQWFIDLERMRTAKNFINNAVTDLKAGKSEKEILDNLKVQHLWFPEPHADLIELREGNPPADCDRPKHLRGFRLEVDPFVVPERVVDALAEVGFQVPDNRDLEAEYQKLVREVAVEKELHADLDRMDGPQ